MDRGCPFKIFKLFYVSCLIDLELYPLVVIVVVLV